MLTIEEFELLKAEAKELGKQHGTAAATAIATLFKYIKERDSLLWQEYWSAGPPSPYLESSPNDLTPDKLITLLRTMTASAPSTKRRTKTLGPTSWSVWSTTMPTTRMRKDNGTTS